MNILEAIILGLVEGITEYLPVSSTGHLILTQWLLGLDQDPEVERAVDTFMIVIQGGAILAVLGLYANRVKQMLSGIAGSNPAGRRLVIAILIAFLPAAVLGILLDKTIESVLMAPVPVVIALAAGGVLMIIVGRGPRRKSDPSGPDEITELPIRSAFIIGLVQCLAMIPGTSRSMVTIVAGMLCGLRPVQAAEFSFLLGLPTLGGACVYKLLRNLSEDGPNLFETLGVLPIVVGLVTATIAAAAAISWLVGYLNRHGLAAFGWYRIGLAILMIVLIVD
ncbi:MAG: undecaprenyl-diphosphate phosphatase [Phycisphaerae bacterium]|nr:undecaprenyl-diphosphate phosphatase [Phycisphaerae bacterium]|tara:strand:+ start:3518 stop:4354 length:837 start_codon:yes stop_codon:yes gene_type:complete